MSSEFARPCCICGLRTDGQFHWRKGVTLPVCPPVYGLPVGHQNCVDIARRIQAQRLGESAGDPDELVDLQLATTDQLVEELGRRFSSFVLGAVGLTVRERRQIWSGGDKAQCHYMATCLVDSTKPVSSKPREMF